MAFYESPRFPEAIAYGAIGGPGFSTQLVAMSSGQEQANAQWAYPRHAWDVAYGIRTQAQFDELRAFFVVMRGRLHRWRFKDFTDFQATMAQGRAVAITATTFQLVKRYTIGGQTFDRQIRKPIAGTVAVQVSGSPAGFSLDATTGVVTIGSAPAASNVSWSGEFDVPMRFDVDSLRARVASRNARGLLYEWDQVPIIEVRT